MNFPVSVISISAFFILFLSLFQSALLPTYLSSKPLSHMSILLGVELQIPPDVGEWRVQARSFQLSQSSLNCRFFLAGSSAQNPKKAYCFTHTVCTLFILYVWNGDKVVT